MSIRIQTRRDTTANWESKNTILAEGEIGYDLTEKKFKVGDGTSAWVDLDYSGVDPADLVTSVNSQTGDVVLDAADVGAEPAFAKLSAFNKNFGTLNGTVAQGDHNHSGVYEPVINPKNTAFNKSFGTSSGTVAQGDHNHDTVYLKDAPKDGKPYQRQDGGWVKAGGGGGGGLLGRFPSSFKVAGTGAGLVTVNNPSGGVLTISQATTGTASFNGSVTVTPAIGSELVVGLGQENCGGGQYGGTCSYNYSFKNAFGETFWQNGGSLSEKGSKFDIYMGSGRAAAPVFLSMGGAITVNFNYTISAGVPTAASRFEVSLFLLEV